LWRSRSSQVYQTKPVEPAIAWNISSPVPLSARAMRTLEEILMSKRFLISVAAIALMAGAGAVNAQGMKNEGAGGGAAMQQSAPSSGGGAGTLQKSESAEPGKGGAPMKSTQSEKSPTASGSQRAEDTKGGAKGMTNSQRADESRSGGMKAEGREGRDNSMKAEGRESPMGRDNKAAETNKSTTEKSQTTTGQAGAAAKLSTEQRTKITTVIRNQHVESVKNVNFSISVGTRVPRQGVHFYPLPAEVVTIYPEWRGYEFIEVNGQIIVIEPASYEIVAIL
jgi:hypothetical protein